VSKSKSLHDRGAQGTCHLFCEWYSHNAGPPLHLGGRQNREESSLSEWDCAGDLATTRIKVVIGGMKIGCSASLWSETCDGG
jgi:hypothetical protein